MTDAPTREQEEYIDGLALRFGSTCVRRFDEGEAMLLVCGWEPSADGEGGRRADGSAWEWLDADGSHGPVDAVREALRGVVASDQPTVEQASRRGLFVHEAIAAAAPEIAQPPSVPGPPPEDLAREALRQVVEHWPGDLAGVSLRAKPGTDFRIAIDVTLLSDAAPPLGVLLMLTGQQLRSGSPAVAHAIQRAYAAWGG